MTSRNDIITLPHDSLRQKSKRIKVVNKSVKSLIDRMISCGLDWEDHHPHEICVGLAAVQINEPKRVVILRSEETEKREFGVLINPRLIKTYGQPEFDFEGCLSVSGIYGIVPRYPRVKIQAMDAEGKEFRATLDGFMARLVQHEVDHCEGIVFVDHIKDDHEAFYQINEDGKIEKLDYEAVKKTGIFR